MPRQPHLKSETFRQGQHFDEDDSHCSNFATLPTQILQRIFDRLPLFDLLKCSNVCKEWRRQVINYGKTQVHSIVLLIGPQQDNFEVPRYTASPHVHYLQDGDGKRMYPKDANWSALHQLKLQNAQRFPRMLAWQLFFFFPNIRRFAFSQFRMSATCFEILNILLTAWRPTLVSLAIRFDGFIDISQIGSCFCVSLHFKLIFIVKQYPQLYHCNTSASSSPT